MRLSGGISRENEEEIASIDWNSRPQQKLVVGYAVTPTKTKNFPQPKLQRLARKKGITFIAIDQNRPLSDQGPFDVVLHKLSGKEWCRTIEDYWQSHPEVTALTLQVPYNACVTGSQCSKMLLT